MYYSNKYIMLDNYKIVLFLIDLRIILLPIRPLKLMSFKVIIYLLDISRVQILTVTF